MEKTTNLKTRALALLLTVLMIVGVLPMTVFALQPAVDGKLPADYLVPTVGDMIEKAYKKDSKYWTTVVNTDNASSYYGKTATQYVAGPGSISNSYFQLSAVNGTVPVSETGNVIRFPQDASITNSGWSKNAYNSMMTWNGIRVGGSTAYGTIKGGYAGIDHVITADINLKEDSAAGSASFIYCYAKSASYVDYVELLNFVCDGNGKFELYIGSRSSGTSLVKKLCDLPAGEYFNLSIVFDVGNKANEYYVFVDGEYVGGSYILDGGRYASAMATCASASAEVNGGCPQGIMLCSMSFNSGAVYYDLKDAAVYFYDDTPDDGNYKNATRGSAVGVIYANDFESYEIGANLNNAQLINGGSFVSNASHTSCEFNVVDDGNGGKAFQPNITASDQYFDIWPSFSSWAPVSANSGRSFVLSTDVKGKGLTCALFGLTDRGPASPSPVVLAADGTVRLNYTKGVGANNSIGDTSAMPVLATLSNDAFTNVALVVNVPENYFMVYVDGEPVTEKLIFLSDALIAAVNDHTTTPKDGEPYKTYTNGYALSGVRMNYSGGVSNKTYTYDNILFYWGDSYEPNYLPFNQKFVTPDGDDIAAKVGAENIALFTDFDSATGVGDGAYNASASYRTGKYGFHHNGAKTELIADGNGGKAMLYHNGGGNTNLNYYLTSGFRAYPDADIVGRSFVVSADIKAGEKMTDGQLLAFTSYAVTNNNTYNYTAIPVYVKADGTIYVPDASNGIVTILNGWRGNSYAQAIGKLSQTEFTNVAVQVNPGENWFKVYVNGVPATDKLLLANASTLEAYEAANATVLSGKGYTPTAFSFGYRGNAGATATHYYIWDSMAFYYADEVVTKFIPVFSEGEATGGITGNAPTWTAPNGAAVGDALIYYDNFNSYTDGITGWSAYNSGLGTGTFIPGGSGKVILPVDDGKNGLAMQYQGGVQMNFAWNYGSRNAQNTSLSGKSFTFSADFKLGEDLKQGNLICFQSSVQGSSTVHFTAIPVWVDAAGNLYNGQVTTPTSAGGVTVTAGTLWKQNGINVQGNSFQTAANKIGALSADKYTNVAVSVDVANNVYNIYIDGVCVAANQTFACENVLAQYRSVDMENGTLDYANGFGVTAISLGYRDSTTAGKTSIIFDNWLVYEGELIGWSEDNREIVRDFTEVNGFYEADGLGVTDDYVVYVLNGKVMANTTSADGLLTTDENGKVMFNGNYIKYMSDIYTVVNGELVLKDGIYNGIYRGNRIIGKPDGNLYYYNVEKKMVKGEAVYDIKDNNSAFEGAVGYSIAANGVATLLDGIVELEGGARYYVDGVRKTGLFTVDTKTYFAGANDYLAKGLTDIGNGVYYFFDEATFDGAIRNGIVTEADGNNYYYKADGTRYTGWFTVSDAQYAADANGVLLKGEQLDADNNPWLFDETTFVGVRDGLQIFNGYAQLYIMGVLQTEDSVESFATNNPFYYKGYFYYIELDDGVDGQTNLFFDDSGATIIIDSTVYNFDGYKAIKVADCVIDGKYYDINGTLVKDAFFTGLNRNGETVWYHADTNTGDLLTGYAFDGTVWYYFADVNEAEPYVGAKLNGVHKYDFDDDATTEDTYRYFEDGVVFVGGSKNIDEYTVVVKNNEGDLYVANATDPKEFVIGKWYVAEDANAPYALTLADGVYNSVFAGNTEATYRNFANGALRDTTYLGNGVWYFANANGDLYTVTATDPKYIADRWVVNAGGAPYRAMFADGVYRSVYEGNTDATYRFFQDGILMTDEYNVTGDIWYIADANGDLYELASANDPVLIKGLWYVNGAVEAYELKKANSVYYSVYEEDGNTEATWRFIVNGVVVTTVYNNNGTFFLPDADGDLYVATATTAVEYTDGKWYVATDAVYAMIYADGIIADVLYATGDVVEGDAEGVIYADTINDGSYNFGAASTAALEALVGNKDYTFIYKYENGKLVKSTNKVNANDGRTYDFDATYVGTLRDDYFKCAEEFWWVDGYTVTDGVHNVRGEEMYFEGGKASAGQVMDENGNIHDFGPDGLRIPNGEGEIVNKPPHTVKVGIWFKDGDSLVRLSYKEFYRLYNTSYTFVPGWYECYGYTITINGVAVTAPDGEVLKAVIEASDTTDTVIIVTYDSSIHAHVGFALKADECVSANCKQGGKNVYVCELCTRGGRYEEDTEIEPHAHNITVNTTPATHNSVGVVITVCSNDCGYCITEYLPMEAHSWTEVAGSRVDANCGVNGEVKYECTCGAEKTEILYATGAHNYVPYGSTEGGCAVAGTVSYMCTVCESVYVVVIPCNHNHIANLKTENQLDDLDSLRDTFVYDCVVCGKEAIIYKMVTLPDDDDDDENP